MSLSASTVRWLQKVSDPYGLLAMLELSHSSFTETIRIVNDSRPLTALGHVWVDLPFAITLPSDKAKEVPRARLQMDNVGREIGGELENLPPGASVKATIRIVHRSTPNVVEYQFAAPMGGVKVDTGLVTATVGRDDISRMSAVKKRFDPSTSPSIFAE